MTDEPKEQNLLIPDLIGVERLQKVLFEKQRLTVQTVNKACNDIVLITAADNIEKILLDTRKEYHEKMVCVRNRVINSYQEKFEEINQEIQKKDLTIKKELEKITILNKELTD
jgi:hypothetical protein